uniref:Uncharacterized protein n=1 Tax=Plectus sambesii TaxID=2011161 RepID=A0A914UX47_9BILA
MKLQIFIFVAAACIIGYAVALTCEERCQPPNCPCEGGTGVGTCRRKCLDTCNTSLSTCTSQPGACCNQMTGCSCTITG